MYRLIFSIGRAGIWSKICVHALSFDITTFIELELFRDAWICDDEAEHPKSLWMLWERSGTYRKTFEGTPCTSRVSYVKLIKALFLNILKGFHTDLMSDNVEWGSCAGNPNCCFTVTVTEFTEVYKFLLTFWNGSQSRRFFFSSLSTCEREAHFFETTYCEKLLSSHRSHELAKYTIVTSALLHRRVVKASMMAWIRTFKPAE